jgi:tripartite-type tricarboxylate transporter receptor subunit TctC
MKETTMNKTGRRAALLLLAAPLLAALPAGAADFPDRPIKLVVPFPPGGGADATARLVAQRLSARLGQPVVIDNRAGANGSIGTGAVAKSPPDGYTLLMTDRGALGINPSLYRKLPYDPQKDFAYVGIAALSQYVLVQHPSRPARSLAALVAEAKKAPCKVNYASFGIGSLPQMGMESLNAQAGICTTHVPYKGGGPALAAVMGGEVDVALLSLGPAVPMIRDGRLVPLVVGGSERTKLLPQTPTISETGAPADLLPSTWFGFAYPAQTPPAIVDRVSSELRAVLAAPDVRARLADDGLEPGTGDGRRMADEVRADVARFRQLVDRIGIQPE